MKLIFKQRLFSWFDSYDIFDEYQNTLFTVSGQFAWGHRLQVSDGGGKPIATLQEKIFTFLPKFEIYIGDSLVGEIVKEFTFFKPKFDVDCNGWHVEGDFFEWSYNILDSNGNVAATVEKQLWNWTDTYVIDVMNSQDSLLALMVVLAIDAVKCSSSD